MVIARQIEAITEEPETFSLVQVDIRLLIETEIGIETEAELSLLPDNQKQLLETADLPEEKHTDPVID